MSSRQTEKITALYERLSRDDEAEGDSNSIIPRFGLLSRTSLPISRIILSSMVSCAASLKWTVTL